MNRAAAAPWVKTILPDGREATIWQQLYNWKLCVGKPGVDCFEDVW